MYQGLGDQFELVTSSDPLPTPGPVDTTTLHLGGGYAGAPVISPTMSGGYEGVSTVNAANPSFTAQAGLWLRTIWRCW
jgi:hypothetical protein